MITIDGQLDKITYHNEENHYTIARFKASHAKKPVTVVGCMPGASPGETLRLTGSWETHPRYGEQFKVETFEVTLPATAGGIRKYLGSGIIKGIGPAMARAMVTSFGEQTFEIIENSPERLLEVPGIGKGKAKRVTDAWKQHHAVRGLMTFLKEYGVKPAYGAPLIRAYGPDAVETIRSDPYRLSVEVPGAGFADADALAMKLGIAGDEPLRVRACLLYVMEQFANDGHVYAPMERLAGRAASLIGVDREKIAEAVAVLEAEGELVVESAPEPVEDAVGDAAEEMAIEMLSEMAAEPAGGHEKLDEKRAYLRSLHEAESGIAIRLSAMMSVPVGELSVSPEQITLEVLKRLAIKPSDQQVEALQEILAHRVAVITGGPGTGKTTLIRSVAAIFDTLGKRILLAAPTGRAARRLSEVTRKKAATIHRMLGYNFATGEFDKNPDDPLDAQAVIIDEASMVDTVLMHHLISAVPMTATLILVGDIFQLPSVGPGNILSDIIRSERVKTLTLTEIFRQAQESPIVVNAHKIRNGEFPDFERKDEESGLSEFYFINQNSPETVVQSIASLCSQKIPEVFRIEDIQVLTPMHKGEVGTINLNQVLQEVLNPSKVKVEIFGGAFRTGDKVMHLRNNYQKEVFNGDIGYIKEIEKSKSRLLVDYEGREVEYDFTELDELTLAYTISVHKSQGSEYDAVVVPLMEQHFPLLQRNLLYTAMTRGKALVILIGTRRALNIALANDKPTKRLSSLHERLRAV